MSWARFFLKGNKDLIGLGASLEEGPTAPGCTDMILWLPEGTKDPTLRIVPSLPIYLVFNYVYICIFFTLYYICLYVYICTYIHIAMYVLVSLIRI